ncbi:LPXTG-domain-containing protein [Colletotrichum truncatum]|uniref:LPXTG-domain-containing protein n=1 Tax=Colletotrichum truncatum TaxID=5467 RepID=A0ACC3ZIM1_COLTU|nr:LPXTG-domain-containing protein [Colletotrichum truncatum]KAF6791798.1 LPXTG-domain-containing protein [Colletotrichum truncatum]
MAARSALVLLTTLIPSYVSGLQVTPDSPCASFCLDSNDLDYSDPNSSNTRNKDITCVDGKYQTEPPGRKFQQCVSCLQDSNYVKGNENDQSWFLYNMRYSFDYCIFGYPNATGVGSNPCMTSTACGGLEAALIDGELDPTKSGQFSYCDADGGSMLGSAYDKCLSCVRAGGEHYYLANYLVALEAGCRQRPDPGKVIGLNQTVFTKGVITAVNPIDQAKDSKDDKPSLPMTAIVGIVVGVVVALLLAAGCIFIQYRKRRARAGRGINPELSRRAKGHRPASSLSFRCQTHLTPKTPNFFPIEEGEEVRSEKGRVQQQQQQQQQHQDMSSTSATADPWISHNAIYSFRSSSPTPLTDKKGLHKDAVPLANIKTSLPIMPLKAHSPRHNMSPQEDYTPSSTTSAAPLLPLRPYVPSEHGMSTPSMGHAAAFSPATMTTYSSPTSGNTASPLLSQAGWPAPARNIATIDSLPATEPTRTIPVIMRDLARPLPKRVTSLGDGSPVESQKIQTSFPPPPPHKKR